MMMMMVVVVEGARLGRAKRWVVSADDEMMNKCLRAYTGKAQPASSVVVVANSSRKPS